MSLPSTAPRPAALTPAPTPAPMAAPMAAPMPAATPDDADARPLRRPQRRFTLFLPLSPLLAVLGPLAFLISPPARALPARQRLKAAAALGATLLALSGADIEVDTRHARIRIRIL